MVSNRKAELLFRESYVFDDDSFAELVIWLLPAPARGSRHCYKYRLAYVVSETCVLRYDNEAGKGDHRHWGDAETVYEFKDVNTLLEDFARDIERWQHGHRDI